MLMINYETGVVTGKWVLCMVDENAGKLPDGGFDYDEFEEATMWMELPGTKEDFKAAYRQMRLLSKSYGGYDFWVMSFSEDPAPLPN